MVAGEEFAVRIGMVIFFRAGDVNGAGRGQGDEHVLVDREVTFTAIVLVEVVAEPVGEAGVDPLDGFSEGPAVQRGTSTARIV